MNPRLFSAKQMRRADRAAADAGISLQLLMEAAGRKVAEAALRHWPEAGRILILCGKGNNGGDGYVAARHLDLHGKEVCVLEHATDQAALGSDEARTARAAWLGSGGVGDPLGPDPVRNALESTDLVIDALFGSGLSRALEGALAEVVTDLNASGRPVLSVDVPSGVSADDTAPLGPHVRATRTLQLAGAKVSSVFPPASEAFGSWEVADIGIPDTVLAEQSDVGLLDDDAVRRLLPQRTAEAHKYSAGTVLVVAGSSRYLGAAELAARGAYRAGAGLVTLAAEARLPSSWPEIIFECLDWQKAPLETLAGLSTKRAQARVIGPGLDEAATPLLPDLIAQSEAPTVLDAGALTGGEAWRSAVRAHGRCVLTPHAGEASRLLDSSSDAITADPIGSARQLAEHFGAVAVLKGASSVIAAPTGELAVSPRGHPGMATGGMGDILSGLVGAWLAHGEDAELFRRVAAAVYVHGLAGEAAARARGDGLIASDVIEAFPRCWRALDTKTP